MCGANHPDGESSKGQNVQVANWQNGETSINRESDLYGGLSKRRRDRRRDTTYVNGRGRSPERNYDDGAGEDYRIGTLSKINNIIYCKNDCLQSTTVTGRWVCDDRFYGLVNRSNR